MAIRKRGRTPLACAVWLGLFAAPQVLAQTWWVTDGTTSTVDGQTYDSGIVANIDGAAVRVENAGSKAVGTNITVKTGGENAPGIFVGSGGEVDLTDFTVTTTADSARGVIIGSSSLSLRSGTVSTDGLIATGIDFAQSANATIDNVDVTAQRATAVRVGQDSTLAITNGTLTGTTALQMENAGAIVTATNVDLVASTAYGARAINTARVTLSAGTITAQGASGVGLSAATGASIVAKDGIEVATRGGAAANAASGATITLDDATLRTTEGGVGILADGAGTIVDANAVTIEASGVGVQAFAGSQVTLAGADVASQLQALHATGASTRVTATNSDFRSSAGAAIESSGAKVELSASSVTTTASKHAVVLNGGDLRVDNSAIAASDGAAIFAQDAVVTLGGGTDLTASLSAIYAEDTTVTADNVMLRSTGGNAVTMEGGVLSLSDSSLESAAHGVELSSGGLMHGTASVTLTDSAVTAGARALVLYAEGTYVATASVSGGTLNGASGAIAAASGINVLTLSSGAQLQSANGPLLDVLNGATLTATLEAVDLVGHIQARTGSVLNVALRNASTLDGTVTHGGAFDLATGTSWSLPGDSDVGSLINAGTIAFNDPTAFHTLTVRGDYTGTGGLIALNTQLADDVASSDRLHVIGDTSGSTQLAITNRGGAGALTNADGIRVVQVDGASDGTFALTGRVVGGAYDYLLHQGGVADPTDGDWYLRSELTPPPPVDPPPVDPPPVDPPPVDPPPVDPPPVDPPPVDPPPVDPPPVDPPPVDPPPVDPPPVDPPPVDPPPVDPPPVDPPPVDPPPVDPPPHVDPVGPPRAPVYRPEVGAYLANQQAAQTVFRQRRDDRGVSRIGGVERTAWVRALHNDHRGITGGAQIETEAQANGIEIGSQFGAWEVGEGLVSVGASLGRADIGTREVSNATRYFAFGDVRGDAVTAFATWLGDADSPHGLSLDIWMQRADFEMEVRGQGLAIERYDARATSVSLETGYAFKVVGMVDRALYFEPQFQVVHTDYDMDAHVEANGTVVRSAADGGLAGRVALRLFGDIVGMRPFVEIGARYNDTRQAIAFDGVALDLDLAPVVYETTGGLSVEFGEGWRAWGSVSGRRADTTREVEGQFGVGYRW